MRVQVTLVLLPLVSCLQIGTGTGTGTGTGSGSGGTAPLARMVMGDGGLDGGQVGTNCLPLSGTQTAICEQTSRCPELRVDPGAFPDCGFRARAATGLDLEC